MWSAGRTWHGPAFLVVRHPAAMAAVAPGWLRISGVGIGAELRGLTEPAEPGAAFVVRRSVPEAAEVAHRLDIEVNSGPGGLLPRRDDFGWRRAASRITGRQPRDQGE